MLTGHLKARNAKTGVWIKKHMVISFKICKTKVNELISFFVHFPYAHLFLQFSYDFLESTLGKYSL